MGNKHMKIIVNKNPQDGDLTFVSDLVKELIDQQYSRHRGMDDYSNDSNYDSDNVTSVWTYNT